MPLPLHYLFVAGIGRRQIGPREEVRAALILELKRIAAEVPDARPVAMASAAAGGDQVFLEAAEQLGWPLRIVLPVPAYLFEKDFASSRTTGDRTINEVDEAGLAIFRRFCAVAIEVEVIAPAPTRREAFTRCASVLAAEADVLVALWDRQPGKQGGTSESIYLAEKLRIPTFVLDAATGRAFPDSPKPERPSPARSYQKRYEQGSILADVDQAIRRSLPTGEEVAAFAAAPLTEQHRRFGALLSGEAGKVAKAYRLKNLIAIFVHVGASFVGLLALLFFVENSAVGIAATLFKLVAVAIAFQFARTARRIGEDNHWVKARFVREVNRSLAASGEVARATGEPHDRFIPASIWVLFRHLRRSLLHFHAAHLAALPATELRTVLRRYREKRLQHDPEYRSRPLSSLSQQDYQLRTAAEARHRHHRIEQGYTAAMGLFFLAGLSVLLLALGDAGWLPWLAPEKIPHVFDHHGVLYRAAKWLTVLLPVVSAALLVLPNLWDLHRRRRVAPALAATLNALDLESIQLESTLAELAAGQTPAFADGMPVWTGTAAEQAPKIEAWVRTRFVAIAREAEYAILTEVIGFKSFVENAEIG